MIIKLSHRIELKSAWKNFGWLDFYSNSVVGTKPGCSLKPSGKPRSRFNSHQKQILEQVFHLSPYLESIEQAQMAETLGIQKTALQVFIGKNSTFTFSDTDAPFVFVFRTGSKTNDIVWRKEKKRAIRKFYHKRK